MKKAIIALSILTSMTASANTLVCGLFNKEITEKEAVVKVDITKDKIVEQVVNQDRTAAISITKAEEFEGFIRVGVARPGDIDGMTLSLSMVESMEEGESFGIISNGAKEDGKQIICYKGKAPF